MIKKKYTAKFSSLIKIIVADENDKYVSKASIENLRTIVPAYFTSQEDLIPIAFNSCVINRANRNKDVIDAATAIPILGGFLHKQINLEHDRTRIVGHIINAGFSSFDENYSVGAGSDILTTEDVTGMTAPFNMCLAGVIYKVAVGSDMERVFVEAADPNSPSYLTISASWELAFDDFDIALGSKNLEDCEIVSDQEKKLGYFNYLACFGGSGQLDDGRYVYRLLNKGVLPLGIGLTYSPAAEVAGLIVEDKVPPTEPDDAEIDPDAAANLTKKLTEEEINISEASNKSENNVTENIDLSQKNNMSEKIKPTSENTPVATEFASFQELETALASTTEAPVILNPSNIRKIFADKINELSKTHEAEIKAEKEIADKNQAEADKNATDMKALAEKVEKFEKAEADRAKAQALADRVTSITGEFDLTDAEVNVVKKQISELNDEAFAGWKADFSVLSEAKSKAAKKAKVDKEDQKDGGADEDQEKAKAKADADAKLTSEASVKVIDGATAEDKTKEIPNNNDVAPKTLVERLQSAFSIEKVTNLSKLQK